MRHHTISGFILAAMYLHCLIILAGLPITVLEAVQLAILIACIIDSGNNRTYVMVSSSSPFFSNGETMYFSPSKFTSAGTWVEADYGIDNNIFAPTGKTVNARIPFSNTYGEYYYCY